MAVRKYQELIAWQRAMDLAEVVYNVTGCFPREEVYALTNQVRRAVVSVASNIAEGQGRGTGADFARFLRISQGSTQEVETQILLARRLGYVDEEQCNEVLDLAAEVGRLLRGLHASVCTSN